VTEVLQLFNFPRHLKQVSKEKDFEIKKKYWQGRSNFLALVSASV